jgi:broad specificity phosphatase PhoE
VFTATPEVPLTETGRLQARTTGEWLRARFAPQGIVTSPFTRARQTADILASVLGLPVAVEEDLRERSYGALAGWPYGVVRETVGWDPATYWEWCPPGGGETLVAVAARAGAVLDRLIRRTPDGDVVVVSHGAVMMGLWRHVTGAWRQGRVARNAGVFVVEHRDGRYLGATAAEDG